MNSGQIVRKDWKFVLATILCFLNAFIIGAFHIGVLYLFGIPLILFAAGLILLLVSKAEILAKALVVLVSFLLVPLTFAVSFYMSSAEPETFLIPINYRGEIVVFFDEPCGSEPVYENGRRMYLISNDGVLITRSRENNGYMNRKFFFVTDQGDRIPIPEFRRQDFDTERQEWRLYGHPESVESFTKDTVGAFWAYGQDTRWYSNHSIGYRIWSYNDLLRDEKIRLIEVRSFGKKAGRVLQSCRDGATSSPDS